MNKVCPKCKTETLKETQHQKEIIDVCTECGGLWFEKNEVNRMISEINDGAVGEKYESNFGEPLGISDMDCPECQLSMEKRYLIEGYNTEIDVCRHCDGSWIDRDELEEVQNSHELKENLANLNKTTSWKTYLFQFLSQMPVEYNLKPKRKPVVTYSLIAINTLIFIAYFFDPMSFNYVLENFAAIPSYISHGEHLWTLITCVFLHGSIMHLVGNMYFLYIIGDNLEDALGHKKFLMIYLALGLGASLVSYIFDSNSPIPSLGASGAIAGLFAMYLMWFRFASITFMFFVYQKKLSPLWYFAIWIGLNIYGMISGPDGIDQSAHLGGFALGILAGFMLKEKVMDMNPMIRLLSQPQATIRR